MKYKSVREGYFGRFDSKEYTTIAEPMRQEEKNNMTLDRKIKINTYDSQKIVECSSCKRKTFEMLRL